MIGLNMRFYRDVSPGANKLIESGAYTGMRVPIDPTEIGHQWVLDAWKEWAAVRTLERFCVVAPNYLEISRLKTLDEMVAGVFGDRGILQIGNEPTWLSDGIGFGVYPVHPPVTKRFLLWLEEAMRAIHLCASLPPAMGCYKDAEWEESDLSTVEAWAEYLRMMAEFGLETVCANIYPWDNSAPVAGQLASMRRQIAIAKHVAGILDVPLVITEIGRVGGKPVAQLCQGIADVYVWGAGFEGAAGIYNLPGTGPVEVGR